MHGIKTAKHLSRRETFVSYGNNIKLICVHTSFLILYTKKTYKLVSEIDYNCLVLLPPFFIILMHYYVLQIQVNPQ